MQELDFYISELLGHCLVHVFLFSTCASQLTELDLVFPSTYCILASIYPIGSTYCNRIEKGRGENYFFAKVAKCRYNQNFVLSKEPFLRCVLQGYDERRRISTPQGLHHRSTWFVSSRGSLNRSHYFCKLSGGGNR